MKIQFRHVFCFYCLFIFSLSSCGGGGNGTTVESTQFRVINISDLKIVRSFTKHRRALDFDEIPDDYSGTVQTGTSGTFIFDTEEIEISSAVNPREFSTFIPIANRNYEVAENDFVGEVTLLTEESMRDGLIRGVIREAKNLQYSVIVYIDPSLPL